MKLPPPPVETAIKETGGCLQTEEVRKIQAANNRLRKKVDLLKEEMSKLKQQLAVLRQQLEDVVPKPSTNKPPVPSEKASRRAKSRALNSSKNTGKMPRPRPGVPPPPLAPVVVPSAVATTRRADGKASRRTGESTTLQGDTIVRRVLEQMRLMLDAQLGALQRKLLPKQPLRPLLEVKLPSKGAVKGAENHSGKGTRGSVAFTITPVVREGKKEDTKTADFPVKESLAFPVTLTAKTWTAVLGRKAKKTRPN